MGRRAYKGGYLKIAGNGPGGSGKKCKKILRKVMMNNKAKEAKPPRRLGKLISVKLLAKQKEAKGSDKSQIKNHFS